MTLQTKITCICTKEFYLEMHPRVAQFPRLCSFCRGAKEVERSVTFYTYSGKFTGIDWSAIGEFREDIYIAFECQCGDTISFSEASYVACSCGRVYRLSTSMGVDETHLGDTDYLISRYKEGQ